MAVFAEAFFESHPLFDWWRATEYTGDELRLLGQLLCRQIEAVSSCHTPKQFQAKLPELLVCYCNDDLGDWHPQWRRVRNELETYGRQILKRIAQAEREHKALLVMGV